MKNSGSKKPEAVLNDKRMQASQQHRSNLWRRIFPGKKLRRDGNEMLSDAVQFRAFRDLYHRSEGTARASVILRMLSSWEQNPEAPELVDCLNGLRELTTFRFAEKICEKVKDQYPDHEAKIRGAIWVLRQAFASSRITINDSEWMN